MDTPRSNLGDATYLGRPPPDFDMTQEPSFQSPSKDNNLLQQLRNGRGPSLRTPRANRAPLGDRRNLPAGIGGSEFTPMLKSATRNSARRRGKENTNGLATPALGKIDEDMDMTNVPVESSLFGPSRNMSYVAATPLPEVEASSADSTPLVQPTRRGGDQGPFQDGKHLSLREQEHVIDKIEKENFGLKLKIHFLEEALGKTGPGFSEAALKENTELKVDKVTMQRELSKYKKQLIFAEKNIETYQQQILDAQEKAKKKYPDPSQKAENAALCRRLDEKEAEVQDLQRQLEKQSEDSGKSDQLRNKIDDLEADLRARDREVDEGEEEKEELRRSLKETEDSSRRRLKERETEIDRLQRQLQQQSQDGSESDELRNRITDLEANLRVRDREVNEGEEEIGTLQRKLEELEDSSRRHLKEREAEIGRLQRQLEQQSQDGIESNELRNRITHLETNLRAKEQKINEDEEEIDDLQRKLEDIEDSSRRCLELQRKLQEVEDFSRRCLEEREAEIGRLQQQLQQQSQDGNKLVELHGKITNLEANLRVRDQEVNEGEEEIDELRRSLEEREAQIDRLQRQQQLQHDNKLAKLHDEMAHLEADLRARDRKLNQSEEEMGELQRRLDGKEAEISRLRKERQSQDDDELVELQNEITRLEADLRLRDRKVKEGDEEVDELRRKLKEMNGFEADLRAKSHEADEYEKELGELRRELETKQSTLGSLTKELSDLRNELRHSEVDRQAQLEKIEALEDEVEVLQATLDEESEDASQQLRQADELCQDLRRQLREQVQRADRLGQLEGADKVAETARQQLEQAKQSLHDAKQEREKANKAAEMLKQQLEEAKQNLRDAEQECDDADTLAELLRQQLEETKQSLYDAKQNCEELKRKIEGASHQESKEVTQANQETEDLKRQLLRAQKESKKAELLCEDLRTQVDAAKQELRPKLDRARRERAEYQASAEKLQFRNDRLEKAVQEALAWIQAKNAEQPGLVAPGPIKQAAMATFRYGDVVMDVVDQKDHEAVIRAADSAQRRHEKEIRGMVLQMEWMQARWERESKLRIDGASAKTFLQLQLEIANACNKAQLRRLNGILQDLGLKSSAELLLERQKDRKPSNKLKVFVTVIRAVARMRIDARKWCEHEKTRQRLVAVWEKQERGQKQLLC